MGIVISRGSRSEAAPKFVAYVWGPAPEAPATPADDPAREHGSALSHPGPATNVAGPVRIRGGEVRRLRSSGACLP